MIKGTLLDVRLLINKLGEVGVLLETSIFDESTNIWTLIADANIKERLKLKIHEPDIPEQLANNPDVVNAIKTSMVETIVTEFCNLRDHK